MRNFFVNFMGFVIAPSRDAAIYWQAVAGEGKVGSNIPCASRTREKISSSPSSGFTLAELLVVIGLIAVLIAILIPTIAGARRQANLVKCASNLRQIANACLLNAHDKSGYLPLAGSVVVDSPQYNSLHSESESLTEVIPTAMNDRYRRRYTYGGGDAAMFFLVPPPAALATYLGIRGLPFEDPYKLDQALNDNTGVWKMFMCPDSDALTRNRISSNPNDTTPDGQGMLMAVTTSNAYIYAWSTNSDYAFNEGLMGFNGDARYRSRRLGGKLPATSRTSEMVLATDAKRRGSPAFYWATDGWICWTPDLNSTGAVTLADVYSANGRATDRSSFDFPRHKKRMNILFVDGHVETIPLTEAALRRAYLLTN